jgi:hypothetical protein
VLPLAMFALIIIIVSVILSSQQLRLITTDTFFSCGECFGSFNEVQSDIYIYIYIMGAIMSMIRAVLVILTRQQWNGRPGICISVLCV